MNLQVTGLNLTGSTFSFLPSFAPPAITVNTASVDPSGASATLNVTMGNQAGQFVLVATNADGSSDTAPTAGNTFGVVDSQRVNDDDDGDGFPNGLELILGSDPFDKDSVPSPQSLSPTATAGLTFSVVNTIAPPIPPGVSTVEVTGPTFSIVNNVNPGQPLQTNEAASPTFSIQNQAGQ